MTTYLSDGLTSEEMCAIVLDSAKTSGKTPEKTGAYKYINLSQIALLNHGDWPELITADDYFTTTGASSYDLTSVLNSSKKSAFCRPVDRTVRVDTYFLEMKSKQEYDNIDPLRSDSGTPECWCQYGRTDFRLFPYGSSGDTIYLDWVQYPEKAADGSGITFLPERHNLIVLGAIWMFQRDYYPAQGGYPEWLNSERIYRAELKRVWNNAQIVRKSRTTIEPTHC